jgi:hypothetical protein
VPVHIYYLPEAASERESPGFYVVSTWYNRKGDRDAAQRVFGPFPTMKAAKSYVDRRKREREAKDKKKVRHERNASDHGLA